MVMQTINTIQTTTLTVELKVKEMQETYNVLEEHRIKVIAICFQNRSFPLDFVLFWNQEWFNLRIFFTIQCCLASMKFNFKKLPLKMCSLCYKIFTLYFLFFTFKYRNLQFAYGDMLMAHHLEKRWKKLFNSALYRAQTLQSTKLKFSEMTLNEINIFCADVSTDFCLKWFKIVNINLSQIIKI